MLLPNRNMVVSDGMSGGIVVRFVSDASYIPALSTVHSPVQRNPVMAHILSKAMAFNLEIENQQCFLLVLHMAYTCDYDGLKAMTEKVGY